MVRRASHGQKADVTKDCRRLQFILNNGIADLWGPLSESEAKSGRLTFCFSTIILCLIKLVFYVIGSSNRVYFSLLNSKM